MEAPREHMDMYFFEFIMQVAKLSYLREYVWAIVENYAYDWCISDSAQLLFILFEHEVFTICIDLLCKRMMYIHLYFVGKYQGQKTTGTM